MESILQRATSLAKDLKLVPEINNVEFVVKMLTRRSVIEAIEKERGVTKLNSELLSIFLETNGLKLRWDYCPDPKEQYHSEFVHGGELNLPSIADIYSELGLDGKWLP